MTLPTPLELMGAPGSPYTRKMRALLRFRRIPHIVYAQNSSEVASLPRARPPLLPTFYLPDETGEIAAFTDSTPLIRRFETEFDGRSVLPRDSVLVFLDRLLEDYADEWLTKCMFHYRWSYADDIKKAASILPHWSAIEVSDEQIAPIQKMIGEHQIARLGVVGSNAVTAPVIEESYRRFLGLFDTHLQKSRFLFGRRPSAADFAFVGQLTCLALFDPTPAALTLALSPRIHAWVEGSEELSGLTVEDEDWIDRDSVPETLIALLREVGRLYVPFLLANAAALERGAEKMDALIDGRRWEQKPFPYQGKCLRWLREAHEELSPTDRSAVGVLLNGTGCEALFV